MESQKTKFIMTENIENIPQINELLYTIKLVSGEELLCTLVDEKEGGMIIESPVEVKMLPIMSSDGIRYEMLSNAWMPFSSTRLFFIQYKNILTFSKLNSKDHETYVRMVNRLETVQSSKSFVVAPVSTLQ